MRRKRGSRFTWFPILGTSRPEEDQLPGTTFQWQLAAAPGVTPGIILPAIAYELLDDSDTEESDTASLRDRVEGKDYIVKRVVGKIYGGIAQHSLQTGETSLVTTVTLCAALAILPVTSAGVVEGTEADYNPLYSQNSAKPYMWRRTWPMYNNLARDPNTLVPGAFLGPTNIANVGSGTFDAGHIDCKSARRVRKEERLYLIMSACIEATSNSDETNAIALMEGYVDFRVLGAMRRAKNKSVLT